MSLTLALAGCGREPYKYDAFAECLTGKGFKIYGTEWCPHCQQQKELFGPSFDKINYTDCDKRANSCKEAGITGYPTWIIAGEKKLVGAQSLEELAEESGCELLKTINNL